MDRTHLPLKAAAGLVLLLAAAADSPGRAGTAPATRPTFSVTAHGAAGDGAAKDTDAIAKAIDACAKAGGGVVHFPAGRYLTGAIRLQSKVTLHLDEGATILFSADPQDYPKVRTRWEGVECINYSGLIHGRDLHDIAITGKGTIDGQGRAWWDKAKTSAPAVKRLREYAKVGKPDVEERVFGSPEMFLRPSLFQPIECRNVLVEGVTFKDSPMWTVHPVYCRDVVVRGLTVLGSGPNTDGVNPDSCRDVLIEDCRISTGDDCVTIKSGRDADGRRVARPCENIVVRRCQMERGHGGVVIGSETSGGVRNVAVSDCTFTGTQRGIRLKTQRGRGGVVENVSYDRIAMSRVGEAIVIDMYYGGGEDPAPANEGTPTFRRISFSNVAAEQCRSAGKIVGLTESPVLGLLLERVRIAAASGLTCRNVREAEFREVVVQVEAGPAITCTNAEGKGLPASQPASAPAH